MEILNKYVKKSNETASRILDGEAVVVLPMESMIYTFDPVGTRIWELLDQSQKVADILGIIQKEYEVSREVAERDTIDFINELVAKKMLTLVDKQKN